MEGKKLIISRGWSDACPFLAGREKAPKKRSNLLKLLEKKRLDFLSQMAYNGHNMNYSRLHAKNRWEVKSCEQTKRVAGCRP